MLKSLCTLCALTLALAGCGEAVATHHYVLVHGAWQGAWAWEDVAELLRDRGHQVDVVELPAHGADMSSLADVTMAAYVARTVAAVDAAGEPVILVGHSMGGMVISGTAEARPDAVERLVYVAAYLPRTGESLLGLSMGDAGSSVGAALTSDGSDGTLDLREDALVEIFCGDCGATQQARLLAQYRAEPALPLTEAVTLGAAFESVPRAYLYTTDDQAVSRAFQGTMVAASPVVQSAELATGHSPFLSVPAETADALEQLAE